MAQHEVTLDASIVFRDQKSITLFICELTNASQRLDVGASLERIAYIT